MPCCDFGKLWSRPTVATLWSTRTLHLIHLTKDFCTLFSCLGTLLGAWDLQTLKLKNLRHAVLGCCLPLQPVRMAPVSSVVGVATEAFHKSQKNISQPSSNRETREGNIAEIACVESHTGENGLVFDRTPETRGFIATSAHFRVLLKLIGLWKAQDANVMRSPFHRCHLAETSWWAEMLQTSILVAQAEDRSKGSSIVSCCNASKFEHRRRNPEISIQADLRCTA